MFSYHCAQLLEWYGMWNWIYMDVKVHTCPSVSVGGLVKVETFLTQYWQENIKHSDIIESKCLSKQKCTREQVYFLMTQIKGIIASYYMCIKNQGKRDVTLYVVDWCPIRSRQLSNAFVLQGVLANVFNWNLQKS